MLLIGDNAVRFHFYINMGSIELNTYTIVQKVKEKKNLVEIQLLAII